MNRYNNLPKWLFIMALVFVQCAQSTEPTNQNSPRLPSALTAEERKIVASTNEFGFEVIGKVSAATSVDSNLFVSPLSMAYALAMAYNGADGETRDAISTTLKFSDLTTEQINVAFAGLLEVLTNVDPSVTTVIANAVWYSSQRTLVPEFGEICRNYFDARVDGLDFASVGAADSINSWVATNTNDKIKQVVSPPLDPNLVYMLANAVYFKAGWTTPFDPEKTFPYAFKLADGSTMEADFMGLDADNFQNGFNGPIDPDITYLEKANEFRAFTMPYGDRWFRMSVFLPDTLRTVEDFLERLTVEKWNQWRTEFQVTRFYAVLPKFKFSFEIGLNGILSEMGMANAFEPATADFSKMIEGGGVWIDTVFHKTFVQVDEEGTEAAAVTIIGGPDSIPPSVICDRPFAFIIWEKESGAIMFAGKVARPTWED